MMVVTVMNADHTIVVVMMVVMKDVCMTIPIMVPLIVMQHGISMVLAVIS
jgi:hypothetical protein